MYYIIKEFFCTIKRQTLVVIHVKFIFFLIKYLAHLITMRFLVALIIIAEA